MLQTDTKSRIMDAAEQLFARDGFHTTSLRGLTELANVNLAAVNYHFGSKEGLLQAVISRRLLPLNELRRQKLKTVLNQAATVGSPPPAADLLRAFIEPTLDFRNSAPGAKDFIALIGRSLSEPDETVRNYFIQQILPVFKLLFDSLQKALPDLPADILMARLQFTMGAMGHTMCSSARPKQLIPGFPAPLSDTGLVADLIRFVSAGLEAPC
ncbi:MAG: TetR/AcrR family transcriptional regulator [Deltaproteobacteria bacterium]|nr:TetR/AcrR family transcriptional regulator [Deltaproteobacteria bacterium]